MTRIAQVATALMVLLCVPYVSFAQEGPSGPWGDSTESTDEAPAEGAPETSEGETDDDSDESGEEAGEKPANTPAPTMSDEMLRQRREQGQANKDLLTVEQRVSNLKERVFRSKATLQLLRELVIEGATMGSRVSIWHINKMSGQYTMESVQYFLDGKAIFSRTDTSGGLDDLSSVEIHAQALPPGQHNLQVNMVLRGNGLGIFSYVKSYSFRVQSSYAFTVEDGKLTTIQVVVNEKGGPFTAFADRPDVGYEENVENLREE